MLAGWVVVRVEEVASVIATLFKNHWYCNPVAGSELANKTILFNIDNSPVNLDIYYNSNPITNDIVVQTSNRVVYTFKSQDFLTNITDYDNDQIDSISLVGDLTGFSLNNSPISSGSWISIVDISAEKLKYTPLNQDGYYEKNIQYQAKDINGNISIP